MTVLANDVIASPLFPNAPIAALPKAVVAVMAGPIAGSNCLIAPVVEDTQEDAMPRAPPMFCWPTLASS